MVVSAKPTAIPMMFSTGLLADSATASSSRTIDRLSIRRWPAHPTGPPHRPRLMWGTSDMPTPAGSMTWLEHVSDDGRLTMAGPLLAGVRCRGRRPACCAKLEKMQTRSGDFELTMDELRAIAGYAVACAEPVLVLFQKDRPEDLRAAAALHA